MEKEHRQLQQQFLQLLSITENMQQRITDLEKSNQILLRAQKQLVEWMDDTLADIEHYRENVCFELKDSRGVLEKGDFWYPNIADEEETLRRILEEGASIARFGDGEFAAIQGRVRHKFQTVPDEHLASRLREVLQSAEDNLLIAIADNYGSLDKYTAQAKREIRHYMTRQVRREHLELLEQSRLYYNAYLTRPYVMYADNQTEAPMRRFERLKKIWDGKDCIFVEGKMTGLGVGNDLFDCAASVRRVLGPSENAFTAYEQILECCVEQAKGSLFLLALGPTATVLAYDLCKAGYQAIDIGHIDLEYEWFLRGEGHRTPVEGKYNNEIAGGEHPKAIEEQRYFNQIIADFS